MKPDAQALGHGRGASEATAPRGSGFRVPRLRGLAATSLALTAGISFAVLGAGGSFAYLNASKPSGQAATIAAGTSGLNVQYGSGTAGTAVTIPASAFQSMLPGDVVGVQVNIINVGVVPQTIGASVSATSAWQTRIATGTCPSTVLSGAALTTTSVGAIPLAVGATQAVCLQVTLPSNAAAASENTTATYTVTLTGTQATS